MQHPKLLIIDSGVGGLSVTKNIVQKCKGVSIHYIADTLYFPYGVLPEPSIIQRTEQLIHSTLDHFTPDITIIACNTASTVVLDHLRKTFAFPIVGVVPAIKPAAKLSQNRHIAILATQGTINRNYTKALIQTFAADCEVDLVACPLLVELAENKLKGMRLDPAEIRQATAQLERLESKPDTVVLACTHFPLLKPELANLHTGVEHWVDSGEAIARRVQSLLSDCTSPQTLAKINTFCFTHTSKPSYSEQSITEYLGPFQYSNVGRASN